MNYYYKNDILKEQKYLIGIEPVIDMRNFVLLLVVNLACKTAMCDPSYPDFKIASLPFEYRDIIEKIMHEENGVDMEFSSIIPIYSYYENQREWEIKLGKMIKEVLKEENLKHDFDLEYNCLRVYFTEEKINTILNQCDSMLLEVMNRFSNLINDYSFDRNERIENREFERTINRLKYETEKRNRNILMIRKPIK